MVCDIHGKLNQQSWPGRRSSPLGRSPETRPSFQGQLAADPAILYLTYWYPTKERARTIALFATGGVMAGVIGSPISGAILGLDGTGGLAGWQWLFLLEAVPAVILGLVVLVVLPNCPQDARWLS